MSFQALHAQDTPLLVCNVWDVASAQVPQGTQLPDFYTLEELGVRRISMGNFVFTAMHKQLTSQLQGILKANHFKSLFR